MNIAYVNKCKYWKPSHGFSCWIIFAIKHTLHFGCDANGTVCMLSWIHSWRWNCLSRVLFCPSHVNFNQIRSGNTPFGMRQHPSENCDCLAVFLKHHFNQLVCFTKLSPKECAFFKEFGTAPRCLTNTSAVNTAGGNWQDFSSRYGNSGPLWQQKESEILILIKDLVFCTLVEVRSGLPKASHTTRRSRPIVKPHLASGHIKKSTGACREWLALSH